MVARRPLVRVQGKIRQLPVGDVVDPAFLSANLTALAGLTGAANKAPYFTAAGAMAVYDLTVFGRSFAAAADQAAGRTLLGLGTAATRAATTSATDTTSERLWRTNDLVKQTSANDATAGRVMLTGAGGWMGVAPALTGNDYNNDSEYCGIVKNDHNIPAVNYPPQISANAPMAALNVRFNGSYGWQLGVQTSGISPSDANTRAFLRCEVNGNWSSWAELWHSGNFNPAAKQDAIAAGTTAQFWRGDKTWQDLAAAVRTAVLTGLSTVSAAAVSATDTVLAAIGKLQAQINGLSAASYTNLTLQSPYTWDAAGDAADYNQPSYAKVGDVVRLRGKVTLSGTHTSSATVNVTTIATLPVGFRPLKRKAFQVFWDTSTPLFFSYCLVFVNTNGTILLVTPSLTQPYPFTEGHLPLDQIWFDLAP